MQENVNIPDSTITSALTFRNLVLMNMQQLTNFPYIEQDFDALTDYELLCLVVKFLNDVIANQNEQNDSITNMYNAFLALQTYVNNTKDTLEDAFNTLDNYVRNYFANLDVQDEINNKLEQMLQDGELDSIIEQFLQSNATWSYDTVADMKLATNLINGSVCKTLGFYSINDGGSSTYLIRTKTVDDTPNEYDLISLYNENLVAEYIEDKIVSIKQLGYINTMTATVQTSFMNYVLETYKNILIKNETVTINDSLQIKSNQNIRMESSKIHNTSTENQTFIFQLNSVSNVKISGINSELYFDKPSQAQQACLKITNGTNVYFDGISLKAAGGDGITVSGTDNETISSNINISNCLIDNNRRNGISLIGGVNGCKIINCVITNTSGTNPQYGIDLEPWQDGIYNNNILIENCTIKNNATGGIDIFPYNKNVQIINNVFDNDGISSVMTVAKGEDSYPKNLIISKNYIKDAILYLRGTQYGEYIISDNKFENGRISTDAESDFSNFFTTGPRNGYLHILNNYIKNSPSHGIAVGSTSNILIKNNTIINPTTRGISISASNNIKIVNNVIKDYAQTETDKTTTWGIYIATSYNTLIDGNSFFNSQDVTFSRVISIQASSQRLITVNNTAIDISYTNFLGKDGTVTNEVYANNLTNS